MLSVILKILAVLGIIILILLGIVLFLLLIVLFVPIKYKITGLADKEKKEATVNVRWLFGILRFSLHYSQGLSWQLKLLWFDLKGLMQRKPQKAAETSTSGETSKVPAQVTTESPTQATAENPVQKPADNLTEEAENETSNDGATASANPPEKKTLSDKLNDLVFKIRSICDKIKEIWGNITYYINLLQEEDTKHLLAHCLKVIGNILKSIRPRKLKLQAVIGFDSPDTTGKIYGLLCMLYPFYGNDIHITPDFENSILEGSVFCKGRIYICVILINALRILLDRKFFKVIHKLKNGGTVKNGR